MTERPCPECGTIIAYSARSCSCGWGKKAAVADAPKNYGCAAFGCPLPGSISGSIGANGTYYCRHHFNIPAPEWAGITKHIRSGEIPAMEAKGREDYRAYIQEKFTKEGMKAIPGNLQVQQQEAA